MTASSAIFVGIRGSVVALDRATGTQIWATSLKGAEFVNVVMLDSELYAAARGEVYCLDQATGQIRWHNPLKGFGWGLATIATEGASGNQAPPAQKRKQEREAAAAASAGSAG